jgi:hypothetical protein
MKDDVDERWLAILLRRYFGRFPARSPWPGVLPASAAAFRLWLELWRRRLAEGAEREPDREIESVALESPSSAADLPRRPSPDLALTDDIALDTVRAAAAAVGEEDRFSREDVVFPISSVEVRRLGRFWDDVESAGS